MKCDSRNIVRVGVVSSINYKAGTVRVCFEDKDNMVSDDLPMLSFEYEMPKVGDRVVCLAFGNSISTGVCLGRYFFDNGSPVEFGENIYFKHFLKSGEDAFMRYDRSSKTLTLHAENIVLRGDVKILGNLTVAKNLNVAGSIKAAGSIIDGGGNTANHSH